MSLFGRTKEEEEVHKLCEEAKEGFAQVITQTQTELPPEIRKEVEKLDLPNGPQTSHSRPAS